MVSKFVEPMNIAQFRESFAKRGKVLLRAKNGLGSGTEWTLKTSTFYNQVAVGYQDKFSKRHVQLFPNGSIQVAGCSSLVDCHKILKQIQLLVKIILGLDKVIEVSEPRVCMINTNFSLNSTVNLLNIIDKFKSKAEYSVTFDPDNYSAVKIKFIPGDGMKKVTASIFSTGKIIVTGAQKLNEIVSAYKKINEMITQSELHEKTEKKEVFDVFMGIKYDVWIKNIM
jgi:TATA-box binding protein (TBP) (component of TFIID and TFIIIB)